MPAEGAPLNSGFLAEVTLPSRGAFGGRFWVVVDRFRLSFIPMSIDVGLASLAIPGFG